MYIDYLELARTNCRSRITHKIDMRKWRHLRDGEETICEEGNCENLAEPIWWYNDNCDWQCNNCDAFSCKEHIVPVSWNDFHLLKNTLECDIGNMNECAMDYEDYADDSIPTEGTAICWNCFHKVYDLKRKESK